tara:strand:+ start:554 stop:823 length:270 start_codon:yes stop_codon:yes gene_type:complete
MKDKPRRGRPPGATSFARVKLQDLLNHLGRSASVVVGKKWLDEIGLSLEEPTKIKLKQVTSPAVEREDSGLTSDEDRVMFTIHDNKEDV